MASEKDDLAEAQEAYKLCVEAWDKNRQDAIDDFRFARLGEQWSDEIKALRKGRPMHTINKLPSFIRQVVNNTRQNKPTIKVRPADSGADIKTARVYDGLIRNIWQISNADVAVDTAAEHAVTGGFGFFRIAIEYLHDDSFDKELLIKAISNPFSVYPDPYSTAADSADWNLSFIVDTMSIPAFEREYPDADKVDWATVDAPWFAAEQILVAEQWVREEVMRTRLLMSNGEIVDKGAFEEARDLFDVAGITVETERETKSYKITQRILSGAQILATNEWAGRYIPIVPVYGEDIVVPESNGGETKRHLRSLIRDSKDAQRAFNYHRSTATELVALAPRVPYIGKKGTFDSDPNWATANTESHPFLEWDIEKPERQPLQTGPAAASISEALAANDDMKSVMGLHDPSLGYRGDSQQSGRAIMALQQQGDTGAFHFTDNLSRGIHHAGLILIDLIPLVYTGKRMIRILGQDGQAQTVGVNQPVFPIPQPGEDPHPQAGQPFQAPQPGAGAPMPPPGPQMPPMPGGGPAQAPSPPGGMAAPPGVTGGAPMPQPAAPEGDIPTPAVYDLAAGRYDLVVEAGPSFATKREESVAQMSELLKAYPQAAPIIGDLLVQNMDWPGSDEIAQRLKALVPPNAMGKQPIPPQVQQQMDQMHQVIQAGGQHIQDITQQLQSATTQLEAERAKTVNDAARLDVEQQKHNVAMYEAETARKKMEADAVAAGTTGQEIDAMDAEFERYKIDQANQLKRAELDHAANMQRGTQTHEMRMAALQRRADAAAPQPNADGSPPAEGAAPQSDVGDPFDQIAESLQTQGEQLGQGMQALAQAIQTMAQQNAEAMQMIAAAMTAPKELVKDKAGRPIGVRTIDTGSATMQ